jgi:hypothetical protein
MDALKAARGVRRIYLIAGLAMVSNGMAADPQTDAMSKLRTVLPAAAEMQLAPSAAPEHLQSQATVYVFGRKGFEIARVGTNGFTCLVNRDGFFYGSSQFKP